MKISKHARQSAKQLFRGCFVDGTLEETRFRWVIQEILNRKPRGYLQIAAQLHRLLQLYVDGRTARIESAAPLEPAALDRLKTNLDRRFGPGLAFEYRDNPRLIGGVRVQVGSDVFDGSIRARLSELAEKL